MARSKTDIKRLVREYVNALEPTINVDRIILYGSFANGRPHRRRDIDLAIVSRDFAKKSVWQRQGILGNALKNSDMMIEALGIALPNTTTPSRKLFLAKSNARARSFTHAANAARRQDDSRR